MPERRRLVAAMAVASAAALVGALGTGLTIAGFASNGEGNGGITATWQSAQAPLVAHYTVSRGDRPEAPSRSLSAKASDNRQLPRLNKYGKDSMARSAAAAPKSDNTTAVSSAAAPSRLATPANQSEGGGRNVKASFIGQQSSATTCSYFGPGCNPPDMAVAASTRFVLQGVNTQYEVLDTSGHVQPGWPVSGQSFFGVPNVTNADGTPCDTAHGSQPFMSDPRALYDPIDKRFWAAMLQVENGLGVATDCPFKSVYYIAVSQTSDPRGSWNVYEFNMSLDGAFAADFTQIGVNGGAVTFSANMFDNNGGFYAEIFEANKAKMERGRAGFTADGFYNMRVTGPGNTAATGPLLADTLQPAMDIDGSGGRSALFVNTMDGPDPTNGHFCGFFGGGAADACSGMGLWRMSNPIGHDSGGSAPTLSFTRLNTKPFTFSPPADQPSCNQCVDASDLRISATAVIRNGVLYGAWETGLDNGSQVVPGIEVASVQLSGGHDVSARTSYYNLSGDTAVAYPALMPDAHGNLVMLFDRMSNSVFPETRIIVAREGGQFHGAGTLLKAGETNYRPHLCGTAALPVCRWGDFSAASFDGAGTIWVAGEYANALNLGPPQNGRNWGTWIGAISAS